MCPILHWKLVKENERCFCYFSIVCPQFSQFFSTTQLHCACKCPVPSNLDHFPNSMHGMLDLLGCPTCPKFVRPPGAQLLQRSLCVIMAKKKHCALGSINFQDCGQVLECFGPDNKTEDKKVVFSTAVNELTTQC